MAEYLGTGKSSFRRRYTRPAAGRVSLREKKDGGCVFHSDEGCRVYRARPLQCRTFPFWLSVVRRRESWDAAARECPGMGRGRFYRTAEIVELIAGRMKRED